MSSASYKILLYFRFHIISSWPSFLPLVHHQRPNVFADGSLVVESSAQHIFMCRRLPSRKLRVGE